MPISAGVPAPDFTLQDDTGAVRTLSDYRGQPLVLYFIPRMIPLAAPPRPAISAMTTPPTSKPV